MIANRPWPRLGVSRFPIMYGRRERIPAPRTLLQIVWALIR